MFSDRTPFAGAAKLPFLNPWPALVLGIGLTAGAALWFLVVRHAAPILVFAGLIATGVGVNIRPRSFVVLMLASFAGALGLCGLSWDREAGGMNWDSARLLITVLTAIGILAAAVVLLPKTLRKIVISLVIIFHFGGIVTAVTNIPPNPWLSNVAWSYVYRPYLEFFYLGNAYHFYSPDPGPGVQVWFYVQFDENEEEKFTVADRDESPLQLEYQRRISIAESVNQKSLSPLNRLTLDRRILAGLKDGINFHPELPQWLQYRPPTPWYSARLLESYVRHVALRAAESAGAGKKITGIKVYLVEHRILEPKEVVAKLDPESPWLFRPYFLGDFDENGALKDPTDPYLYWLIPIVEHPIPIDKEMPSFRPGVGHMIGPGVPRAADFLERHRQLRTGRFNASAANIPEGRI
jgi:hypothetical protein